MIKTAFQHKSAVAVLLMALGIAMISNAEQTDKTPPKELVQYIREAKRRGVTEAKIKQQAVAVGWSDAAVDEAIVYEKTEKAPQPAARAAASGASTTPPATPSQLQSAPQPAASAAGPSRVTAPVGTPTNRGVSDDFPIGSGDTLQISVWKEPDVSVPSVVVRPDGKITVPLIKEIEIAGLTTRQAEAVITAGLAKFITDPNVTVVVAIPNSKKIYVIGAARKEGPLPYTYGMSVIQALSEAGGLTDYAKRKKIYILRTDSGREYRLDFNYDEVVKGEKMEQNILLLPGDTVVIPH